VLLTEFNKIKTRSNFTVEFRIAGVAPRCGSKKSSKNSCRFSDKRDYRKLRNPLLAPSHSKSQLEAAQRMHCGCVLGRI
jgi:hypothetical protein